MTDDLLLLFGGRQYDDQTLFVHGANIDWMLKTDKLCPQCKGIGDCKMASHGWQTFFDSENSDMYGYPIFRMSQCHWLRRQNVDASVAGQIAPRFQAMSLLSYKVSDDNREAFNRVVEYTKKIDMFQQSGLLLVGPSGTGKTHLAIAVLRMAQKAGFPFGLVIVPDLLDELRKQKDEDGDLAKRVKEKHFLLLDDLGAEKPTDWASEKLYQLINYRYNYNLPTLITSNYRIDELRIRLGENGSKITDRIMGMCEMVIVKGQSWRRRS